MQTFSSILTNGPQHFLQAFKASDQGSWYDSNLFGLTQFPNMGWGAVALIDIPVDTPLFHIPSNLLLTPYTSRLASLLADEEWDKLDIGWARLILVMMYETSLGQKSKWYQYLSKLFLPCRPTWLIAETESMPTKFDTPMFWDETRRAELIGTDLEGRIGREDADKQYFEILLPIIQAHPDIFPPNSIDTSLEAYHLQGSRILSRSFTIPRSKAGGPAPHVVESDDSDSDSDEEEGGVAAMVWMADMLNAAYELDNARLYDTSENTSATSTEPWDRPGYTMRSTKLIKAGEQIYNTYDSPPNSELLRKYGHVDQLPLPQTILELLTSEEVGNHPVGNPGDEVFLPGDMVLDAVTEVRGKKKEDLTERVDWWLEEGYEDTFPLTYSDPINEDLIPFIRLMIDDDDWSRAQHKGKRPHAKMDQVVQSVLLSALDLRAAKYKTSIEDDLAIISDSPGEKRAAVVRLGEKRILNVAHRVVMTAKLETSTNEKKRTATDYDESRSKKKR
ncbi:hypothetical protein M231_07434 [Tremella mesenterica]|uniref:SET domain-containing protein n=1 Tax=Tremella mesenterica TaxID=5217 RepID=A0A4Q1BE58_TREME|nr:uncharacterized protein TREMEDRAFT_59348 [Tremella mesenterica DSM 1558]EIW73186.1 hypothetical protein TREMEDRAFT_59348 [Tremella mesenterica DSM 1558]RXK35295.1 hypothetical protein M231_07434 [Tremella mesenterica]